MLSRPALALASLLFALPAAAQIRYGTLYSPSGAISVTPIKYPELCRLEFLITSLDKDHHAIEIEYSISGWFKSGAGLNDQMRTSRSHTLRTDAGPINLSLNGPSYSMAAWMMGMDCGYLDGSVIRPHVDWEPFGFRVTERNLTEAKRKHEEELRRQKQAKIDERDRKKRELEERKRKSDQTIAELKRREAAYKWQGIEAYRRANPNCLVNDQADVTRCEQAKRVMAENEARENARLASELERLERERQSQAALDSHNSEIDRLSELTRNDPCAGAAEQARQPMPQSSNPQYQAALQAQRKQAQAALDQQCAQSRGQAAAIAVPQQAAPSDQANFNAQQTVRDAASKVGAMRDENAELQRLLNNMK